MHLDITLTCMILQFLLIGFASALILCVFARNSKAETDSSLLKDMLKWTCIGIGLTVIFVFASGRPVAVWWALVLGAGLAFGFIYNIWVQSW